MSGSRGGRLATPDFFRVVCIGGIAWYHIWQLSWLDPGFSIGNVFINLQQVLRNGYMLVDMLLLLSGFLLFLPYARHLTGRGAYPDSFLFYKKRALRILPCYWLAILIALFAWAIPTGQYDSVSFALRDVFAHLTFTHNLSREVYYLTKLPGVLWTMAVEVQFYLFFPLIARLFTKQPWLTWGGMTLLALLFRLLAALYGDVLFLINQLPLLLDVYAAGMLAAYLFARLETKRFERRWPFAVSAAVCFLCLLQILYLQTIGEQNTVKIAHMLWRFPLALCGAGFLLFGSLAPAGFRRVIGNPVTVFLSGVSYNFYIWHQFLARRLVDWHVPAYVSESPNMAYEQPWQSRYTAAAFAISLLAAVLATYLVEKPSARWGEKRLRAKQPS